MLLIRSCLEYLKHVAEHYTQTTGVYWGRWATVWVQNREL